jgi:hypothetical protein
VESQFLPTPIPTPIPTPEPTPSSESAEISRVATPRELHSTEPQTDPQQPAQEQPERPSRPAPPRRAPTPAGSSQGAGDSGDQTPYGSPGIRSVSGEAKLFPLWPALMRAAEILV